MSIPVIPDWQPTHLSNELVQLLPLQHTYFQALFCVASDPLIWEQHPNPNRYMINDFTLFFEGAMASGGAFIILDSASQQPVGSSRFYEYDSDRLEVKIGYTFFARSCWGKGYNAAAKALMIGYALQWAQTIIFHVGAGNLRSQIAMQRLGACEVGRQEVAYFGEPSKVNIVYEINRQKWLFSKP